jgi:hypothetical protein
VLTTRQGEGRTGSYNEYCREAVDRSANSAL